jgi:hypothetical protein
MPNPHGTEGLRSPRPPSAQSLIGNCRCTKRWRPPRRVGTPATIEDTHWPFTPLQISGEVDSQRLPPAVRLVAIRHAYRS